MWCWSNFDFLKGQFASVKQDFPTYWQSRILPIQNTWGKFFQTLFFVFGTNVFDYRFLHDLNRCKEVTKLSLPYYFLLIVNYETFKIRILTALVGTVVIHLLPQVSDAVTNIKITNKRLLMSKSPRTQSTYRSSSLIQ